MQPMVDCSKHGKRCSAPIVRQNVQKKHAVRAHAKRDCSERFVGLSAPIGAFGVQNKQPLVAQSMIRAVSIGTMITCLMLPPVIAQEEDATPAQEISDKQQPIGETTIDPELLKPVLQPFGIKTSGVRDVERDPYYSILNKARKVSNEKLKSAAADFQKKRLAAPQYRGYRQRPSEFPIFVDLFKNPLIYHGKPVTLRGHVLKLIPLHAGKNDFGLTTLYEAWIYTDDSQNNPAVVVVSSIPDGIPTGTELLIDNVSVTGYFFKNYAFRAQDRERFAPMLLGQRLEWSPPAPLPAPLMPAWISYTLVVVGMTFGVSLLWFISKSDRKSRRQRALSETDASIPIFDDLLSDSPDTVNHDIETEE